MYSESRNTSRKCRAIVRASSGIAGIEGGLAAAGLRFREIDLVAQALQHLGDRDADLGKDLIDDAGDEQGDARAHCGSLTCPVSLE